MPDFVPSPLEIDRHESRSPLRFSITAEIAAAAAAARSFGKHWSRGGWLIFQREACFTKLQRRPAEKIERVGRAHAHVHIHTHIDFSFYRQSDVPSSFSRRTDFPSFSPLLNARAFFSRSGSR